MDEDEFYDALEAAYDKGYNAGYIDADNGLPHKDEA